MRVLFLEDEPECVDTVRRLVAEVLDAEVLVATTVEAAVELLHADPIDLLVADLFLPLGARPGGALGPRARRYAQDLAHLGGLVLLDELDRVQPQPKLLIHTACTDHALLEMLDGLAHARVPKPAPVDVLLRAVLEVLGFPVPG